MPYLSTAERIGLEKGIKQGIKQGIAEGRQDALIALLEEKFGTVEPEEQEIIKNCNDTEKLNYAIRKVIGLDSKEKILELIRE